MRKPKVQPPTPPQLGRPNILAPLRLGHAAPDPVPAPILVDVVRLGAHKDEYNGDVDADQVRVAAAVLGLVVVAVDEVGDDAAELDGHLHIQLAW
jgi:hypothetical protein